MAVERPWVSASNPAPRPECLAGVFCLWEDACYPFPPAWMALLGPSAASSREAEHLEGFLQLGERMLPVIADICPVQQLILFLAYY